MAVRILCGVLQGDELGVGVHVPDVGQLQVFAAAGGIHGRAVPRMGQGFPEALVHQGIVRVNLLLLGLGRSSRAALQGEGAAVDVHAAEVGGGGGVGNVGILVEVAVVLGHLQGAARLGQAAAGVHTAHHVIVERLHVLTVVVDPGESGFSFWRRNGPL